MACVIGSTQDLLYFIILVYVCVVVTLGYTLILLWCLNNMRSLPGRESAMGVSLVTFDLLLLAVLEGGVETSSDLTRG